MCFNQIYIFKGQDAVRAIVNTRTFFILKYVFLKSCTKSLESYDWLKLVVELVPSLPPPTSPSPSTSTSSPSTSTSSPPPSSSLSILCIPKNLIPGIVSPLSRSRPSHVLLGWLLLVQGWNDLLGEFWLRASDPRLASLSPRRVVVEPHMLCPGERWQILSPPHLNPHSRSVRKATRLENLQFLTRSCGQPLL